ncbi:hypothetical protein BST61_g11479 [Cercospora zeina]
MDYTPPGNPSSDKGANVNPSINHVCVRRLNTPTEDELSLLSTVLARISNMCLNNDRLVCIALCNSDVLRRMSFIFMCTNEDEFMSLIAGDSFSTIRQVVESSRKRDRMQMQRFESDPKDFGAELTMRFFMLQSSIASSNLSPVVFSNGRISPPHESVVKRAVRTEIECSCISSTV